jgi:hypothetical protein
MTEMSRAAPASTAFRVFIAIALVTVWAHAVYYAGDPLTWVATADNDDIMRLLSVRGWLAGQGWFDMHQYRIMPPEGIDMHWSRYIDAAIGGLITLLSAFLPPLQAENIALVAWPTALLAVLVLLTGEATRRVFGANAAILAILSLLLWPVVGTGNFAPYRIDHHNVQILMISVMVFCLIVPGRPLTLGLWGGLAGAVSLSVGMEMLLVIGLVGIILALRTMLRGPGAGDQLLGFGLALWLGSLALFAGQTAPAEWSTFRCDELSPPYLALTTTAALVSLALARAIAPQPLLRTRIILTIAASGAAAAALFPVLSPCLRGPYADMPPEAQALIYGRINEAQGLFSSLRTGSDSLMRLYLPALLGVLIACGAFSLRLRRGLASPEEKRAVGVLLLFAALGLVGSLGQLRMLLLSAPAIPVLTGYGLTMMLGTAARPGLAGAARSCAVIVAMFATIFLPLIDIAVRTAVASPSAAQGLFVCRSQAALSTLANVPKGVVLAPIDFGGSLILLTPHDAVAGPYHRSADAFLNGFVPFDGDEATLRDAMRRTGADYLLLCRDFPYGEGRSAAFDLAGGGQVDWLEPVSGIDPELVLLRRVED